MKSKDNKDKQVNKNEYHELRRRAERVFREKSLEVTSIEKMSDNEILSLINELKIYQLELEMQNEDLQSAHLELEISQSLYCKLFELAPVGYITLNNEGAILKVNYTCTKLFNLEKDELSGRQFKSLINGEDQDTYYLCSNKLFNKGEQLCGNRFFRQEACEIRMLRGDGMPFWVRLEMAMTDCGAANVDTDGIRSQPLCLAVITDISEIKQYETELKGAHDQLEEKVKERTGELEVANKKLQAEIAERKRMEQEIIKADKLEAISGLAGGIAHDFNNYLAAFMGNISLALRYYNNPEKVKNYLEKMEEATERAKDLSYQLFTFARGGSPVKKTQIINGIIKEGIDFALRGTGVISRYELDDDLYAVDIDEGLINQVLYSITANAVQAMSGRGFITVKGENITVDKESVDNYIPLPSGEYVKISVTDEGSGISPDIMSKIFDPFFTTKNDSRGMGLTASYSIIRNHDGHITAESEPGRGTTLIFILPASTRVTETVDVKEKEKKRKSGVLRVLVMDDDEIIRDLLVEMLEFLGYTAESARDGKEAIDVYFNEKAAGRPFDLVLLDLTVPGGMGGRETIEILQQKDPAVKAIISSGYSNNTIMAQYERFGFKGAIKKPYTINDLSEVINKVI